MGMYTKSRRKNTDINTQNGYQRFIHNLPQTNSKIIFSILNDQL